MVLVTWMFKNYIIVFFYNKLGVKNKYNATSLKRSTFVKKIFYMYETKCAVHKKKFSMRLYY